MRIQLGIIVLLWSFTAAMSAGTNWPTEGDPKASGISKDPTYGVSEKNPVRVGQKDSGPKAETAYLASLRGPKGETLEYKRQGSCCPFKTSNALVGGKALLDSYEVTYAGAEKPIIFYLDMYDYEQPLVPPGFTKAP